jgi:hypothetical protein
MRHQECLTSALDEDVWSEDGTLRSLCSENLKSYMYVQHHVKDIIHSLSKERRQISEIVWVSRPIEKTLSHSSRTFPVTSSTELSGQTPYYYVHFM